MPGHSIVAVGASAGGVEALTKLVAGLPDDLAAAVFVVLHVPPESVSLLPKILGRAGALRAAHALDGEPIEPGRIYIAPPDRHLLVKDGRVGVIAGPKENRHRPAIDPLFRTAARIYGPRVIGVVLSGTGDDGAVGLRTIKNRGGLAVVQDPADAAFPELPQSAITCVDVDHIVRLGQMAALLAELIREPSLPVPEDVPPILDREARLAEIDLNAVEDPDKPGTPSAYSCPDCGGVLWEIEGGDLLRFRCRVGHSYTAQALADEQQDRAGSALWAAFRTLEEHASFARRLAARARRAGHEAMAERFLSRAEQNAAHAAAIRGMLVSDNSAASTELQSK